VKKQLTIHKVSDMKKVTRALVRKYLRDLKHIKVTRKDGTTYITEGPKYYKHTSQIAQRISGRQEVVIPPWITRKIRRMFSVIGTLFEPSDHTYAFVFRPRIRLPCRRGGVRRDTAGVPQELQQLRAGDQPPARADGRPGGRRSDASLSQAQEQGHAPRPGRGREQNIFFEKPSELVVLYLARQSKLRVLCRRSSGRRLATAYNGSKSLCRLCARLLFRPCACRSFPASSDYICFAERRYIRH
jgi:hypothetical protein